MATTEVAMPHRYDKQPPLADDLIWGVGGPDGIAAYLGIDVRKARYLIDRGEIPVQRKGHRTIVGSRSELRRVFGNAGEDTT
jgi:hypothetical protein